MTLADRPKVPIPPMMNLVFDRSSMSINASRVAARDLTMLGEKGSLILRFIGQDRVPLCIILSPNSSIHIF